MNKNKLIRFIFWFTTILFSVVVQVSNSNSQTIVINEFLASNGSINSDSDGDFEDWIELHNTSNSSVNLEGITITDDESDVIQWVFPDIIIPGKGYLLVWASGKDLTSGELHTNFKLGAGGEFIGIYSSDGSEIDKIEFGKQTEDISFCQDSKWNREFSIFRPANTQCIE